MSVVRPPGRIEARKPIVPKEFRRVCGLFATGVTVITAGPEGQAEGTTVNSFTSVSLDPSLVLFCLHKQSRMQAVIGRHKTFAVNFLAGSQQELARSFATRRPDGFHGVPHHFAPDGPPLLSEALAHLTCSTVAVHAGGDHDIVVGEVLELAAPGDSQDPLIFFDGTLGPLESLDGRFGQAGPGSLTTAPVRAG
ncbi:flavin reductase family protein [Streptomyces bacillaris]|uniref:flavin reductase family protein n=1 Tax=Streptomyces TaxID=1883 RepID=UPI000823E741|nr:MULTISPECIES: flavin reductase family protein [unclassified Streptomyces]SCK60664.1 NADH-FMN oxidoreductase RutF, flavin reductase (DIM6/NTAB) family [Streptomyces sp. AmelKG-D3]